MSAARYKGVHLQKTGKVYTAGIMSRGKAHHLGMHTTPEEAARVYDEACIFLVSRQHQQTPQAVDVMSCCNTCVT